MGIGAPIPPAALPPVEPPQPGKSYDPTEAREKTRGRLAVGLAILLAIVALTLVSLVAANELSAEEAKDLGEIVFSPIVVLTGTALGFYFGVQQQSGS